MKYFLLLGFLSAFSCNSRSQNNNPAGKIGGPCEGCEAIYESPVPFEKLNNMCWLPDWNDKGPRLAVNGIVYNADGTPAAGVIIYIYHTDQSGVYPKKGDEKGWGKRHGYLRGWMKTNEKGEYKFFTLKPGSYPQGRNPAHIHVTVKEPDKNEYWIDEYLFDDDRYLTDDERKKIQNRGGDGILKTKDVGPLLKAERHIYLGKNIPDYL
ncbi:MAG: intradiol ring-cleavage dioxygenase [Bacteroidetes bacterium]|nr:intradiol ring-cleavage dioxygenase [Bacteroidota bacterium]